MLPAAPRRPRLLIVDDNITNLKVALEHLQAYNFEILTARSGETGLARAQSAQPDLILLDVRMPPGLDGFETCRRLKANPLTAPIPVIFMTAQSEVEDKVRGFDAGGVDYVLKPFDAVELLARVNTHLKLSALQSQLQQANAELNELVAQLEQRNAEMVLLNTLSQAMQSSQTAEEAHAAIGRHAARLLPAWSGAVYLMAPPRGMLEAVTAWGAAPPVETYLAADECWALRQGRPHQVPDPPHDPACPHAGAAIATLCIPMLAGGDTLGILHLRGDGDWPAAARQLAIALAEHLALLLSNLNLRETLRQQSIRDPLTGLYNRRYLEETLEREAFRARRSQSSLGLIMLDIDHFKRFNDANGHEAGDAVLEALGRFLQEHIRGGDVPCRYGGEEFTLILPGAGAEAAAQRAEELRVRAGDLRVSVAGRPLGPITLSLGVAVLPLHGASGLGVLQAADAALYQAKQSGRNRVVIAE